MPDSVQMRFTELNEGGSLDFGYKPVLSPKEFFFPQTECLLDFDFSHGRSPDQQKTEVSATQPTILVGVKPCDAQAITLLDKIFIEQEPEDPYYASKRSQTKIVTVGCTLSTTTCFCSSVGGSPDSALGADIFMLELDKKRFFIEPVSLWGKEMIRGSRQLMAAVTESDIEEKDKVVERVQERLRKNTFIHDIDKKISDFAGPYWERIHLKCLGCGVCTYLCPTCHCFDITDEILNSKGRRIRTWDSCQYGLFTLHASGHNPRPTRKERIRQRIMHKFNYSVECYGKIFCVGCGRCVARCPVNLDLRSVLRQITEGK